MMKKNGLLALLAIFMTTQTAMAKRIQDGPWRFEMQATYAVIPFVIEFRHENKKLKGTLLNGKETINLGTLHYYKKNNALKIPLGNGQQSLDLLLDDKGILSGNHVRHNKDPEIKTRVTGIHGQKHRYPDNGKRDPALIKLTGKWEVTLNEDGKTDPGVVIFEQDGNKLYGSILTPTGDYRYFEGFVSGINFEAASFDGSYNYVFRGTLEKDKLKAEILANYRVHVEGKRNEQAALPDAYKQTQVSALKFKFPDVNGKETDLEDAKFKNRPVVVTLYGSWCPNCMDEMNYLIPWYNEHKKSGVEIITLAFERALKKDEAIRNLKKVIAKKKIPFTVLMAGYTADDKPMDKLPGLKNFISFPTTIFLNKKHEVVKVHAGFTGPSTGEFFDHWKKEFAANVEEISK
jgi:thiol-disulfide isomerase/thioredoxin